MARSRLPRAALNAINHEIIARRPRIYETRMWLFILLARDTKAMRRFANENVYGPRQQPRRQVHGVEILMVTNCGETDQSEETFVRLLKVGTVGL